MGKDGEKKAYRYEEGIMMALVIELVSTLPSTESPLDHLDHTAQTLTARRTQGLG